MYYDVYGRVTSVERPEFNTSYTYDALNRLTGYGTNTVTYDANGNITVKSDVGSLSYTHAGKPYAVTGAGETEIGATSINQTFAYNAGGDRIEKSNLT